MKTRARILSGLMAATMFVGLGMGSTEVFARSSTRAAWNNAAGDAQAITTLHNTHSVETDTDGNETTVKSNVYANSEAWSAWQKKWNSIRTSYEQIALTPGKNATELNCAWYSKTQETPQIKLFKEDGTTLIDTFDGVQNVASAEDVLNELTEGDKTDKLTLYPSKVTVKGLQENTTYKYQYYVDGAWSETYTYTTKATDKFSMLYVGDPQIGASKGQGDDSIKNNAEYHAMNDAYNWNQTLSNATKQFNNLAFILSAGDQINQTSVSSDANKLEQQMEYAGFLSSEQLRSLPVASTIGNHDSKSKNYSNHFNNPNTATSAGTTEGATTAGTDYYFSYGNALFVVIDTNNYNCATHENVIKEALASHKNATWKVIMFHQDIYGSGYDHSDSDGIVLRTQLTPIIDKYGFDAVLQGHDHTYSRTYQISAKDGDYTKYTSAPSEDYNSTEYKEYMKQNNCYDLLTGETNLNKAINPEGAVYFEANSSTGSKYYQMIGTQQNYIAARSQSWRPTYSVLDITDTTLTVNTYDAATGTELVADGGIDTTYTIVKSANKTALESEITSAKKQYDAAVKANTYSDTSLKSLADIITASEKINSNLNATETEFASAITSLQDAVKGLTLKSANVTVDTENATTTESIETAILSAIPSSTENIQVTVPANTNVSKAAMEAIKNAGLKLTMNSNVKSKATWKFNSIKEAKDFNPEVTVGAKITSVENALKKLSIPATTKMTEVSFAFDGDLPGTAEVTLDLSKAGFANDTTVYLYYCDEATGQFELTDEATYKDGTATFEMTHCSDYVVTSEKLPAANTSVQPVKTGDNPLAMILWFVVGILGMVGVTSISVIEYRRKKNMNE